ncbi:phosphoribosylamine--glycine ligase [Hyphococcus luteus]|uniref:Phosphoribosylamine--glycine ligase n=1 Tax=Hyphococcus luteus TaxID=2058213 RepID=A0A2S7K3K7_9PROT|nr:phosphoribosylamine--glycine ligase [Marinicaulis flavus]PQA87077.1 phosphoribosylamine--glycine ligase [Marinicaulis flavus]
MKVLLVGGGGREHALAWKIAQSPELSKLYLAPGGAGLNHLGEKLTFGDGELEAIADFAAENAVDLVVVGPEAPLAAGLGDLLREKKDVACFGPGKAAAQLESSKSFMKEVASAAGAPTAGYGRFETPEPAKAFLRGQTAPYVIKADGLAAGKGVVIAETLEEADVAVDEMLGGKFGEAGAAIVIEEFMRGEEASFFAITDGENILPMIGAQDHKRAYDGDKGPNTGGMGAYSPAPVFTDKVRERTMKEIIEPVVAEMKNRGTPYVGVLYAGLMIEDEAPRLVEFNARFGDPECQILMRRLKSDLLPVLYKAATGDLKGATLDWSEDAAALVVMAAQGYPGAYEKGTEIKGVETANELSGVVVFHAGTKEEDGKLLSNGGRVLNVTATGHDIEEAVARAYAGIAAIDWPDGFYRKDIGWRALERRDAETPA